MKIFLAGIMQGSLREPVLHNQDYRRQLRGLLADYLPEAEVYDPLAEHGDSLEYGPQRGREVFFHHNRMCRDVDIVLAFVPEASMGTAIEMWEAHTAGRIVVTISPLELNWAVRFLSDVIYPDEASFTAALTDGSFAETLNELTRQRQPAPPGQ